MLSNKIDFCQEPSKLAPQTEIFRFWVGFRSTVNLFYIAKRQSHSGTGEKNRIFWRRLLPPPKCWLGWKDLNPRNGGVRVRCLTTWRHPSNLTNNIISRKTRFVKRFYKIFQKILIIFLWVEFPDCCHMG